MTSKNTKTQKWLTVCYEKALTYEVVFTVQKMSPALKAKIEYYDKHHLNISHLLNSSALYIGYASNECHMGAILLSDDDIVIIENLGLQNSGYDYDGFKYEGIMTHKGFWKYLETFPNMNHHLIKESKFHHKSLDYSP